MASFWVATRFWSPSLFKYANGRFLADEEKACHHRHVRFDVDQLCAIAVTAGGSSSPIKAINKIEGGFCKAFFMRKEDGSEVVAPGQQLFNTWSAMTREDQFRLVEQLTQFEADLYLCESMTDGETWADLDRDADPSGQFYMGPSCERAWSAQEMMMAPRPRVNNGPWPNLPVPTFGPPGGSVDEQVAVLNMAREVMSKLDTVTLIDRVSVPEDPTRISSLIDWQSIVVSPLYLQDRFLEFLSVEDDYVLGLTETPKLPQDYQNMDPDDKKFADLQFDESIMSKYYELSTVVQHLQAYHALLMPDFTREIFTRCGEASEKGVIPHRACLIEFADGWSELGFPGERPFSSSEEALRKYDQQFQDYRDFHRVQDIAKEGLSNDSEGWISPQLDFAERQGMNIKPLEEAMRRSSQFNKTPEEIREIWPFLER
ncbi:hypothetical protein K458DRAFT_446844 [Lentithecium fluviatile CBS 122367]|uniref:Aminoglycoside phosphotransferase domain-containing protein n=1 Tax=Lentithecium fluviatile CBS 122367 TaxID=1168545 RepID=A0A6G1II67_9PLEO|nr:hypothetical protein K458DRAFT_446844 [Lentithecium fluviatile CBS 122367]